MKVVINTCFGGFSLSKEAAARLGSDVDTHLIDWPYDGASDNAKRSHPHLVSVIEEMGARADGEYAQLEIIEIPFNSVKGWYIDDYDGIECVRENHSSWS